MSWLYLQIFTSNFVHFIIVINWSTKIKQLLDSPNGILTESTNVLCLKIKPNHIFAIRSKEIYGQSRSDVFLEVTSKGFTFGFASKFCQVLAELNGRK